MDETQRLTALYSITVAKLSEIKATQEIILKAQATFLAALSKSDWKPIFEDLRQQAREAANVYREQSLNEIKHLLTRDR